MGIIQITGGNLKSRKITFQEAKGLRPTLSKTREAIFNVLNTYIDIENSSFLDLCGGSGIMAFEAISRGFSKVVCNEANPSVAKQIKANITELSVDITLTIKKAETYLSQANNLFTVIYLDPPYQSGIYQPIIEIIQEKKVLEKSGFLIIEKPEQIQLNFYDFDVFKTKKYSDKQIVFLR